MLGFCLFSVQLFILFFELFCLFSSYSDNDAFIWGKNCSFAGLVSRLADYSID